MSVATLDSELFKDERYSPGLGTYSLTGEEGVDLIRTGLEAGYRHVDTGRVYENESDVGNALAEAAIDREDVLVATKVAHAEETEPTPDYVRTAVGESRDRLGVGQIDLLYHHWPRDESDVETVLPVFEELVDEGSVANIAVSNYPIQYFERAEELVDIPIVANQIEMHPLLQQREVYEYLRRQNTHLIAYAPIAQGEVFNVPEIVDIAEKHDTTSASVSLAWLLDKDGVIPIPRSSSRKHIEANLAARDLTLDDDDIATIESIDREERFENPNWMEW